MKVLIIPEDPTLDGYILKPIVEKLFEDLGRPARVMTLTNPRIRGVAQALNKDILTSIIQKHPMMDLFLVLVDRDGDKTRRPEQARALEAQNSHLFVCLAIEEVEVWMLAVHRDSLPDRWSEIRADPHPKERYAYPFLAERAPKLDPGGGRKWAMGGLNGQWKGVLSACEELGELRQRIQHWLEQR